MLLIIRIPVWNICITFTRKGYLVTRLICIPIFDFMLLDNFCDCVIIDHQISSVRRLHNVECCPTIKWVLDDEQKKN